MQIIQITSNTDGAVVCALGDDGNLYEPITLYETSDEVAVRRLADPDSSPLARIWIQ
ncbi:hypothetical protein CCP3SC1AL1_1860002 [Gammaproteobacteria bacterium]